MDFREHIRNNILSENDRILEFGPLNRPTAAKDKFPNVKFADIRSTEDIKKLYTSNDYLKATGVTVDTDTIVDIDYVIKDSYKNTFKDAEKFDVIILSHVIEHIPDIIGFFTDVATILKDDGKLVIIYPDARYCFDHFRNGTRFIDAYEVYDKRVSNAASVFDFTYNVVKENDAAFFWQGSDIMSKLPENGFSASIEKYNMAIKGKLPDDVHFWPFSDYQFIKFLYDMNRADLLKFNVSDVYETIPNTQEFMVVLSKSNSRRASTEKYEAILRNLSESIKASQIRQKISLYDNDNNFLTDMKIKLESEIIILQNKLDELEIENRKLRSEKNLLLQEKNNADKYAKGALKELDAIKSSNSWKVTKPMREVVTIISRIRK